MAFKTIADLSNSVAGILTGTNLQNVTNLFVAYERAARTLANHIDVPEATLIENYMLYNGVYDYLAPDNIFGGAVVDFRQQGVSRAPRDFAYKMPVSQFDRQKAYQYNGYSFSFEYINGTGVLRVATPNVTPKVVLDPMNATTGWIAAGTASGLAQDTTVFYQQPASLRFLQSTGTGTLTKTLTNALSLANYEGVCVAFLAIMIPTGTPAIDLTSVSLKLGSDATNYDEVTATTGFLGAWRSGDFLLAAFAFAAAAATGTPDWSALAYVQVSLTSSANITNMRVGNLFLALPSATQLIYQTAAIFLEDGMPVANIVDDSTEVMLNPAAFVIYEHECAKAVAMQMSGGKYTTQIEGIDRMLNGRGGMDIGLYGQYTSDNPSGEIRTVGSYYDAEQG